jgi:tetratricopeptide (TPR) repeat protein
VNALWAIVAASVVAFAPTAVQATTTPRVAAVKALASDPRLENAAGEIDHGRYGVALELVGGAQKDGRLSLTEADWAAYLKARALVGLGRGDEAEKTIRERYAANANGYTWASLVAILVARGRHDQAAAAILDLKEEEFIMVNRLRPVVIENIVASLDEGAVRDRLIVRLVEGRYSGPTALRVPDALRLRYVSMLVRQNRVENAARQTESLEAPWILSVVLTDKAFAPLWEHPTVRALMAPGALVARVERGIQLQLEQAALTSTDWLNVMRSLRVIGKADEAVKLGLHAVEQARKEKRPAGAALRLEIANAYADLGEAWAARRTARALLKEEPSLSLSLRVAIAQVLDVTGDDDGALQLLATLEGPAKTPLVIRSIACAAHDLGREGKRDEAVRALEALQVEAPVEAFDAFVCTGNKEKAATVLKRMFEQPETRATAITLAQLYADPINPVSDQNDMRYRMKALVATAAVQEAIQPYGRSIPLPFTIANARGL